jgi:3'(2'), 5'-bisphosphate nucleotidase
MTFDKPAHNGSASTQEWKPFVESIGGSSFVVEVARQASRAILDLYQGAHVEHADKEDGSPVSAADLASAAVIVAALSATNIPVVCEEGALPSIEGAPLFWLVDPLDGTREFLARNGEFSVNIALVSGHEPVLGVIAIPVTGEVFVGVKGGGTRRILDGQETRVVNRRSSREYIAAVSRSFGSDEIDDWLKRCGVVKTLRCGSAIKFCRLAEGQADLYLRLGRTMEWDTAAGQVVIEEAGCRLVTLPREERLVYGKSDFANSDFIAIRGDVQIPVLR